MQKVITQLQKIKNQEFVLSQYVKLLKKFELIREEKVWEEKVWEETVSGKKEHRGYFNYYVTEKGNKMLNIVL